MYYALSVYRYHPEVDAKPYWEEYTIEKGSFTGNMLLDLLEAAKRQDESLTFRRSCGEGVCGSDGMSINGKNGLACITPLSSLPEKIRLMPLPSFPVIRDLVVDLTNFYKQYESVKPYLQNKDDLPVKERIQTQEQRKAIDGMHECILCACCTSSCPSSWWNPEKFAGPSALLWANRFLSDSRDTANEERLEALNDLFKLYRCRGIMNCVDTCPKGLNPTQAITSIKKKMLKCSR